VKARVEPKIARVLFVVAACAIVPACADDFSTFVVYDTGSASSGGSNVSDAGPDSGEEDADTGPSIGGGDCDFSCLGECVPLHPGSFFGPVLVWVGPNDKNAPACPHGAPVERFVWYDALDTSAKPCGDCACAPSTGACALPSSITAHAAACTPPEGATATPTDPPMSWDGTCTTQNALPPGLSCGSSGPCVQSITFGPLAILDESCAAVDLSDMPQRGEGPQPSWGNIARVCEGSAFGACNADQHCVPVREEGFMQCVYADGDVDCQAEDEDPEPEYTKKYLVYESFEDHRVCSPCTCGPAKGSVCSSTISLYPSATCIDATFKASASSAKPTCLDINPAGQAITAKTATEPLYQPGVCQPSGGEVSGDVEKIGVRTICCLP